MTTENPPSPITREALYEAVWTTAMHVLAPRFGYTDRGLAKLCQRQGIPVPPRGYWAKVRAGHKVRRPPLPPAPEPARPGAAALVLPLVERPPEAPTPEDRPPFSPEIAALQMKLQGLPPIAVREDLRGHHEVVPTGTQSSTASERRPWTDARYAPGLSAAVAGVGTTGCGPPRPGSCARSGVTVTADSREADYELAAPDPTDGPQRAPSPRRLPKSADGNRVPGGERQRRAATSALT